jgi:ferredoxin-nitrite reductase
MADEETQPATPRRPTFRPKTEATPEEVLKRNSVERVKKEKAPYDLADEYDRLSTTPYEEIAEEDMLRLQWHGLYHDKPKIGFMMMRIKLPNGILSPDRLRAIAQLSADYGRGHAELTTRQDVQLHWIRLTSLPDIFARLEQAGLSTRGGCGDVLRNITGCPVSGIDAEQRFDANPVVLEAHRRFSGNPLYGNLPRKHKWTISACPYHCNGPEFHDVALVGTHQDGAPGFSVWVGGGLSASPRIGKPMGVFVGLDEALDVPEAILQIWNADLKYRMSRAKARFKFMVDDHGPEKIREMVEAKLGRRLADIKEEAAPIGRTDHMGVHPQSQPGLFHIGFPVHVGLIEADQMLRVADIAESLGGEIRLTREQNLILTGVPESKVEETLGRMKNDAGLSLDVNPIRGHSIACTGEPHCNFAVGETKPRLAQIIEHLELRLGPAAADLRLYLDGCPHACGQHWVGDVGVQGTTLKTPDGKEQAYDLLLRGGLGAAAAVGKAVIRRVRADDVKYYIERLLVGYLGERRDGESIQAFFTRKTDEELTVMARGDSLNYSL